MYKFKQLKLFLIFVVTLNQFLRMNFRQKTFAFILMLTLVCSVDAFSQGPPPPNGGNVNDVPMPIDSDYFLLFGLLAGAIGGYALLRKKSSKV